MQPRFLIRRPTTRMAHAPYIAPVALSALHSFPLISSCSAPRHCNIAEAGDPVMKRRKHHQVERLKC